METDVPLQLIKEERRLERRIAELEMYSELASRSDEPPELAAERSHLELGRRSEWISLQDQLAKARKDLRLIQKRKSRYGTRSDIPAQLVEQERHLLEHIEGLERSSELISLQDQLAEAGEDLMLIEERKSQYVLSSDIPLQLIKDERQVTRRIADLESRIAGREEPSHLASQELEGRSEHISLQDQLAEAHRALALIHERKSEYEIALDVPLQLIKEERRLERRIAELEQSASSEQE
jgi:hypothetical protein